VFFPVISCFDGKSKYEKSKSMFCIVNKGLNEIKGFLGKSKEEGKRKGEKC
jgi:hypothetical protein